MGARAGTRVPFIEFPNEKIAKHELGLLNDVLYGEAWSEFLNFLHCYIPFLTEKVPPAYNRSFTYLVLNSSCRR